MGGGVQAELPLNAQGSEDPGPTQHPPAVPPPGAGGEEWDEAPGEQGAGR